MQTPHLVVEIPKALDEEGHADLREPVGPGELKDDVRAHEVVAHVERGSEARVQALRDEEAEELVLHKIPVLALREGGGEL